MWYFAHLSAPGLEAIGATLPGVPAVVLGRNEHIAWGFTNTGPDVQDLYLEKLHGEDEYLTPEGPRRFEVIDEVIRVKGAPDHRLRVRITRHGPVISDVLASAAAASPRGHVLALAWTALAEDDLTVQSALGLAGAHDWTSFLAAARGFHSPQQNMVYADRDGNIGFVAAGRVPLRRPDNDLQGLAPAPGWEARYDWAGYVPFDELPRAFNPRADAIVTANHRIAPPGYRHHITSEWQPPYRARRIAELLDAVELHDTQSFARIQSDSVSLASRELLPRLLATRPRSPGAETALRRLATWDGDMNPARSEPLILTAWWREIARMLYADELGTSFRANWRTRAQFVTAALTEAEQGRHWCDDTGTAHEESCDELLALSLEAALAELRRRHGEDMTAWTWGDAHAARHEHRPFSRQALLARVFDIAVPSAGDGYSVNVGRPNFHDEAHPFANRHAASLRAIYDLADPQRSLFIHSGGQSGNPLSAHYRAFSDAWARGEYVPMITDRARLDRSARLLLTPAP